MLFYRLVLLTLLAPLLAGLLLQRLLRGRETLADLKERLGGGPAAEPGRTLWLHAASVGEAVAARRLAEALLARDPGLRLVMTANSVTGRTRVSSWNNPRIVARLAPVDTRWATARFLARWQPVALVTIENELWPNRMATMRARGRPVLVAGARLSERSARLWRRFPRLAREVLGLIDHLAPQDAGSAERLAALGLASARIGPVLDLKALVRPDPPSAEALAAFALDRDQIVLAASTHPGEEETILAAFADALARRPDLRLILAPRHPERGEEVAKLIAAAGFDFRRRSAGEMPGSAPVYLADTLGEMSLWYALAGVTFVAGSFTDRGGHTPYEPVAAGSAVLHGPDVANHAPAYAALDAEGGAVMVTDRAELAAAILTFAQDPSAARTQAARARAILEARGAGSGGLEAFLDRLTETTIAA